MCLGGAVEGPHDPLSQEEIPEQACNQQVLPKQLLKQVCMGIEIGVSKTHLETGLHCCCYKPQQTPDAIASNTISEYTH